MKRSHFIRNILLGGLGISNLLYALQIEPFWVEFVKHDMPITNLPKKLKGKTVMHISDLHVGDRFDRQYLIDAFREAKKYKPDYVVYTGDFINYEDISTHGNKLHEVMSQAVKGDLGTFAVLGNHDYGKKWKNEDIASHVIDTLKKFDINVLRNEIQEAEGLYFMGIDDCWSDNFKPKNALKDYRTEQPTLTLCHNPDVCDMDVWEDYQGWILSGHTHGGQVKPPFLPPFVIPVKNKLYTSGLFELSNNRKLYINRALGHLYQVRFLVRPEITLFTLS